MQSPFCSIIILNYNGEKFLAKTIESLFHLDYPKNKFEIIIVDNASSDNSKQVINSILLGKKSKIKSQKYRSKIKNILISVMYLDKNIGFAAGNNTAIKQAKGEYVVLLNNDCTVYPDWLKELVTCTQKNKKIFAVNSKVFLGDTNKIQNAGIRIFPNGYAQDIGAIPKNGIQDYEEDRGQYDIIREIDASCAVATLYRKSIFDEIGFFDERFFMYYEDVEISKRAHVKGYKIMYAPKAVVRHQHASTSAEWSPFFIYHSEKGRLLYVFLHYPFSFFLKEYVTFCIKAKLRFFIRLCINPKTTRINWQYIKVAMSFLINFPCLFMKCYKSS